MYNSSSGSINLIQRKIVQVVFSCGTYVYMSNERKNCASYLITYICYLPLFASKEVFTWISRVFVNFYVLVVNGNYIVWILYLDHIIEFWFSCFLFTTARRNQSDYKTLRNGLLCISVQYSLIFSLSLVDHALSKSLIDLALFLFLWLIFELILQNKWSLTRFCLLTIIFLPCKINPSLLDVIDKGVFPFCKLICFY